MRQVSEQVNWQMAGDAGHPLIATMNDISLFLPTRVQRLPLTRDQSILLMAAFNEFMLGVDTYLAHVLNGTIGNREWIPILFGPLAGTLLLIAGLIAVKKRHAASWMATIVFLASMLVGVLGAYFHWVRGTLPTAPPGYQVTIGLLVWAPPFLAPFAFAGIGLMGLSAAWLENPPGSGLLEMPHGRMQMPFRKTRAYFFLVSLGVLVATISSALDHARQPFNNPFLWIPIVAGILGTMVPFLYGLTRRPFTKQEIGIYIGVMVWLIIIGMVGSYLHIQANLTSESLVVPERFLRGAPFLSPLLFANMGIVGLLVLLPPDKPANP